MKPYPAYKDSGFPWLGLVPEHWQVIRNKYILREVEERSATGDETLLSLTRAKGLIPQAEHTDKQSSADTLVGYRLCRPNQIVMNRMQAWSGMFAEARMTGLVSPDYSIFAPIANVDVGYLCSLYKTPHMVDQFFRRSKGVGTGFFRLYTPDFADVSVPLPPPIEQAAIVGYIDRKTADIERFITKKRRLIALLNEQKAAIINRAVTKGLNPDAPMKVSGVEWLGEVPKHWEVKRLKYVSTVIAGQSPHESTYNDAGVGEILINGPVEYSEENFGYTRSLKWTTDPKKMVPKGTLLFCMRGSTTGRLNITHTEVSIGRGVSGIIANNSPDYLQYVVIALSSQVQHTFKGSTFPSISSDELGNYMIASPPTLGEKEQIISHIKSGTQKVDAAVARIECEMELIREYWTALISEAVTGKIDVREKAQNITT